MQQTYIIGDLHSDYSALQRFLKLVSFDMDNDRLICCGDILDRGISAKATIDAFIKYGFLSVQGNHCQKLGRIGNGNKCKIDVENLDTIYQLGDNWKEYTTWLANLPLYIPFQFEDNGDKGFVIHSGVGPNFPIEKQSPNMLLRGRTFPFEKFEKGKKQEAPPWANSYLGHLGMICHGHIVCPEINYFNNPFVLSLDGGCVYTSEVPWGGHLRGIRLSDRKVFKVPGSPEATRHYLSLWEDKKVINFLNPDKERYIGIEEALEFLKKRKSK